MAKIQSQPILTEPPYPQPILTEPPYPQLTRITVNAENCFKRGDGKWVIEIPIRDLSSAEMETIRRLFPHLYDNAYELLNKEALLAAMTI